MKLKILCFVLVVCCALGILPATSGIVTVPASAASDETVRGVWAPTVYALDFPSAYSKSESALKKDMDNLLNNVQTLGYNTLFFQVRPSGDAFYNSDIFPWSKYLTGTQGVAPENNFDPLAYITEEAHKRDIKIHAWINPYRITASASENDTLSDNSIAKKYPSLVVKHSDGKLYLNPGIPEANKLVVDGAVEILRNYDVDGIHIDDYFYPGSDFPDSEAFAKYKGTYTNIGDWRRNNITSLIRDLDSAIHAEKPDAVFSVSPFGIWANKKSNALGSDTSGSQSYSDDYADSRLWVKEEIVDWIIPQIYWNTGYAVADFTVLAKWWESVVSGTDVKLCIGQSVYKAADETKTDSAWYGDKGVAELKNQNTLIKTLTNSNGYIHYRLESLLQSSALTDYAKTLNAEGNNSTSTVPEDVPETSEEPEAVPEASDEPEKVPEEAPVTPEEPEKVPEKAPVTPEEPEKVPETPAEPEKAPEKAPEASEEQENPKIENHLFSDLDLAPWATEAITGLYNKGIIKGMDDGTFGCRRKVTRADFTIMLVRIIGKDAKVLKNFTDVSPDKYYYHEIGVARVMGLTNGRDGIIFDPTGNITREDMATMVYRLLEKENKLNYDENYNLNSKFTDSKSISEYAKKAVSAMCSMGLLSGYDTGDFQPKGLATRAETAVFLYGVSKLFN